MCNCDKCNGIGDGLPYGYVEPEEVEVEEAQSVYEKLVEIEKELTELNVPASILQKVIDLAEEIDSIDTKVIIIKDAVVRRAPVADLELPLGNISKLLY